MWQIWISIVHWVSSFNIFIHVNKETEVEYFYFRLNYTILIKENEVHLIIIINKTILQWETSLFLWKVQAFPQQYISCVFQEAANKFQKKEKQFDHNFCYSFLPPLTKNNKITWTCQSLLWLIAFLVCVPHFILWLTFLTQEIVSKRQYIKV